VDPPVGISILTKRALQATSHACTNFLTAHKILLAMLAPTFHQSEQESEFILVTYSTWSSTAGLSSVVSASQLSSFGCHQLALRKNWEEPQRFRYSKLRWEHKVAWYVMPFEEKSRSSSAGNEALSCSLTDWSDNQIKTKDMKSITRTKQHFQVRYQWTMAQNMAGLL
jgi:hypothetical protein